jgi:hypothetical protein
MEDDLRLGGWVLALRQSRKRLLPERIAALEALPGWTWDPRDDDWQRGLELLRRFVEREGHARVPRNHQEDGFALGGWVTKRREDHRRQMLKADRLAALEALPGWTWNPRDDDWRQGLEFLQRFVEREGHARVPHSHREGEFALGFWVANRRIEYRGHRLPRDRVAALEAVRGWTWLGDLRASQHAATSVR